jgi:hypothetical protein
MKENTVKGYSVRSARRRKAKNKSNAEKRSHAIRVVCAAKPTDEMLKQRRYTEVAYSMSRALCQEYSKHAVRHIAMVEKNAVALKQVKASLAHAFALATARGL